MQKSVRNRQNRKNVTKAEKHDPNAPQWLWGTHPVLAALSNPKRKFHRLCVTRNAMAKLNEINELPANPEELQPKDIDQLLPREAVHQGMAALVSPLAEIHIDDLEDDSRVIVFDQLTDPHNIGAIFRSAAAFGFTAAILQTKNVPPLTGIAAKTAAGALEAVKEVRVVNISRAIESLQSNGFHVVGLDGSGDVMIDEAVRGAGKIAIVIGAEGSGLRQGVAKSCDQIAQIPIERVMESLNASNAAAIAFYQASMTLRSA
ncbi:23S rRNA (guanosine(2251)-2'-O)-methyltransferase RlmB [Ponticaulis sp.]|uniref:23S rRNA (guanosine(2251)-2'-O)-methyltransferase RlmB n=1 Tax=Ponticaulis sp. TaxID=2020902 RepID=UPI000B688DF6|nr:23S rRNA (guanosine(2251)-2'-O)-methyltransferase RlmB [Ponticaulis sp.]MAI91805.1 23S rRNA (guanosine(2251)-2'-O)-methyltransferase RlmB [Ponticaulis sp.]OUX96676.1 MAG: 23S rRNA (guanosine(2251)-2'-O)-methyltransferase RlmB [Hyphomonadaceae bacterium TMED5]|tara:strand:+ start:136 stop:915 length:780 start_codon:yes stop_codon:yes gene_type:complete